MDTLLLQQMRGEIIIEGTILEAHALPNLPARNNL
jgi:hypothetical protein